MCEDCRKYTVSCRVLEGFECCKCCGIIECDYDICPQDEKIIKGRERTKYEFNLMSNLSWIINDISNAKNAFIEGRYDKYYHRRASSSEEKLKEFKKQIKDDMKLSIRVRKECLERIRCSLISCKDLCLYLKSDIDNDKGILNKTTMGYINKNINRFSNKSIGRNRILCREEKMRLLNKKGIKNPFSFIK